MILEAAESPVHRYWATFCLVVFVSSYTTNVFATFQTDSLIPAELDPRESSSAGEHLVPAFMPYSLLCVAITSTEDYASIKWQRNGHDIRTDQSALSKRNEFSISIKREVFERKETVEKKAKLTCSLEFTLFSKDLEGVYGCYISNAFPPNNSVRNFNLKLLTAANVSSAVANDYGIQRGKALSREGSRGPDLSLYNRERRLIDSSDGHSHQFSAKLVCGSAKSIKIVPGSSFSIPCNLGSQPDLNIDSRKWCVNTCDNDNNVRAESSNPSPGKSSVSRLRVVNDQLIVKEALLSDVGTWECKMTFFNPDTSQNDYKSCYTKLIHIPKIIKSSPAEESTVLSEDEKISLKCSAEAVDSADITWFVYKKDPDLNNSPGTPVSSDYGSKSGVSGQPDDSKSRFYIQLDRSKMETTLKIDPVKSEDSKYFACQFRTSSGVARRVFKLTVKPKYNWMIPLVIMVLEVGVLVAVISIHEYKEGKRRKLQQFRRKYYSEAQSSTSMRPSSPPVSVPAMTVTEMRMGSDLNRPSNFVTTLRSSSTTLAHTSLSTPSRSPLLNSPVINVTNSDRSNSCYLAPTTPTTPSGNSVFDYNLQERRPSGAVICRASPKRVNQLQEQALMSGSMSGGGSPITGMANWFNRTNKDPYDQSYYGSQL